MILSALNLVRCPSIDTSLSKTHTRCGDFTSQPSSFKLLVSKGVRKPRTTSRAEQVQYSIILCSFAWMRADLRVYRCQWASSTHTHEKMEIPTRPDWHIGMKWIRSSRSRYAADLRTCIIAKTCRPKFSDMAFDVAKQDMINFRGIHITSVLHSSIHPCPKLINCYLTSHAAPRETYRYEWESWSSHHVRKKATRLNINYCLLFY